MSLDSIIPGQVENYGIGDESVPVTTPSLPSSPCNYPVISLPTPKGKLGMQFINIADFPSLYGDIQDVHSPYYNAISALIANLAAGGQASLGIRRVTGNTVVARVAVGIKVTEVAAVTQYKRNVDGSYATDELGARIIDTAAPPLKGLKLEDVLIDVTAAGVGAYGALKVTTETSGDPAVTTTLYPLFELPAGIGDVYNRNGITAGLSDGTSFDNIADFVEQYGIFPFSLKMYTKSATGVPVWARTPALNQYSADFTLFPMTDANNAKYSLPLAVGAFTGDNVNRPHVSSPAPFYEATVYQDNIETVARMMYAAELAAVENDLVSVPGVQPFRQMNLLTAVNHNGIPYYAIELNSETPLFNLSAQLDAAGGISPFLTADLKAAGPVKGTYEFDPAKNNGVSDQLNIADAWSVAQALILPDLQAYASSLDATNWVRNRQSIIFDVGYNMDIKNALIDLWNTRKDQVLVLHAGMWLETMTLAQRYSLMETLSVKLRMYPESTRYGTPAARAMINLWDGKIINETTGLDFPLVIDFAYAMARFGGNASGLLSAVNSPDHGDNRILSTMWSPTIEIEANSSAANNFAEGALSLRPYDSVQYYRPALPTVYNVSQSVLKDFVTVFTAACMEKLVADCWSLVSGDTTMAADTYLATVKDEAESNLRSRMGTMFTTVTVNTFYDENNPNSRSIMRSQTSVGFRKGKYMMDQDLLAYNEQDLATSS